MRSKINKNSYGGKWIATGLLVGVVIPAAVWFIWHKLLTWLIVIGALILLSFLLVFLIEMRQDNKKVPYHEKHMKEQFPFDPEKQDAIIKCSICTGEKVAGFKNKEDGHFVEVMLLRTPEDERKFKEIYGLSSMRTEY